MPARPRAISRALFAALLAVAALAAAQAPAASAAEIRVAVSVAPVHSLTAMVAGDRAEGTLLVPPGASPHDFALRPSAARALSEADVVIAVGAGLDGFLDAPIRALGSGARVLILSQAPGVTLLPIRENALWADGRRAQEHDGHEGAWDPHIWLDPANARASVAAIASALSDADPEGAPIYAANAADADARLAALEVRLEDRLASVRGRPFALFHDAYQYFERRFGLTALGAISGVDGAAPSPRRLAEVQEAIRRSGALCVFSEPQFDPRLAQVAVEGAQARAAALDPLGASIPPGPDQYSLLMEAMADGIATCLGR